MRESNNLTIHMKDEEQEESGLTLKKNLKE